MKIVFRALIASDSYNLPSKEKGIFFIGKMLKKALSLRGGYGSIESVVIYDSLEEHPEFKNVHLENSIKSKLTAEEIEFLGL